MLDDLRPNPRSRRPRRRKGRGNGSGNGTTAGRGTKGAGARSGRKRRSWYEAGGIPLQMRIPKVGFHNRFRTAYQVVNVGDLARLAGTEVVDAGALQAAGLVRRADQPVKVLGEGSLESGIQLRVAAISQAARAKVEAAGGQVEILGAPRPGKAGSSRAKKGSADA